MITITENIELRINPIHISVFDAIAIQEQIDATIQYALGNKNTGWWKKDLTREDLKVDSPYNTYKYKGLPLGPISNPGLSSILAAIYPEKTSYWYYLSATNGKTIFSKTFAEHRAAQAKY